MPIMAKYQFRFILTIIAFYLTVEFFSKSLLLVESKVNNTKPHPYEWMSSNIEARREPTSKLNFISWLIDGCFYYSFEEEEELINGTRRCDFDIAPDQDQEPTEYQSFDGFFNNVQKIDLGAVDTPLIRRVPPVYEDGVYAPVKRHRINPLEISEKLMKRTRDCGDKCGSITGKSAFLVYFGQQIVEEILDAQRPACPPEYFNIEIPDYHEYKNLNPKKSQIPVLRSRYAQNTGHSPGNPRQQLNEITPWIDGGLVYGTSKAWSDVLRTFPNGTFHPFGQLASDNDEGLFPVKNSIRLPMANPPPPALHKNWTDAHETANVNRFYVLGNPRGNENPFLLTFGVVLFRWHNQFATYLHQTRPKWSGERIFQEARKWTIATYQKIVVYDWLAEWLTEHFGHIGPYKGYDPTLDPQIEQFFQTAAMRFGHTLVTPGVYLRDYACNSCKPVAFHGLSGNHRETGKGAHLGAGAVRTCNSYWRPQDPLNIEFQINTTNCPELKNQKIVDIDRMLMGMSSQLAEREDNMIVDDLRGRVFGPLEFSRRDLMALNIQRGRDHGIPDYNTARESFGLKKIHNVSEFFEETGSFVPIEIIEKLEEIHKVGDRNSNETAWENIDVWTGGILETSFGPGPLFRAIIKDQFRRIRDADRFWFENTKWKKPRFSGDQIARIKTVTIYDIILDVSNLLPHDIQRYPFSIPGEEYNNLTACEPEINKELWNKHQCTLRFSIFDTEPISYPYPCYHFHQLGTLTNPVEDCTLPGTYDYFSGSEVSFILTFVGIGLLLIGLFLILVRIANYTPYKSFDKSKPLFDSMDFKNGSHHSAREWIGFEESTRPVAILITDQLEIKIHGANMGEKLRELNLKQFPTNEIQIIIVTDGKSIILKNPYEYDLVLEFQGSFDRQGFISTLENYLQAFSSSSSNGEDDHIKMNVIKIEMNLNHALKNVVTKNIRDKKLKGYFEKVFKMHEDMKSGNVDIIKSKDVENQSDIEITKVEFANALGMSSDTSFVERIFSLFDKNNNGYMSFLEFLTMLQVFHHANAREKVILLFQMYDTKGKGYLTSEEFKDMLNSMVEAASASISKDELNNLIIPLLPKAGLAQNDDIKLENFLQLFANHVEIFGNAGLQFEYNGIPNLSELTPLSKRITYYEFHKEDGIKPVNNGIYGNGKVEHIYDVPYGETSSIEDLTQKSNPKSLRKAMNWFPTGCQIKAWFQRNHLELFWVTMYTLVVIAIFAERAYYYSVEREHVGLRHIAGPGVTITRGAASVMMFCYSSLLLTMCRTLITNLRETFLHRYIPFDSFVSFHKYIAYIGLFATIIHIIGHGFNFYHISTQSSDDLICLFRDYYRSSHILPKFHYWMFGTLTGLSGILLTIHAAIIYIFATSYSRMNTFRIFWITHSSYPFWYILIVLHGSGRMIQEPLFFNFLIGPLIIFIADKLMTISRNSSAIPIIRAEILPSDVTKLTIPRPIGFTFRSGQWIRIACNKLNPNEFHPFTISSSPNERHLTVHIRAVGPFTMNIRRIYERFSQYQNNDTEHDKNERKVMPKLFIEGPFGEGHQDWHKYEVSILIGGGIGVTPFSSILKDVANSTNSLNLRQCKKIYFLWITRTQKQFEWMVDIIREVEGHPMITVNVYITQIKNKFDFRTTLLYICEENFQRVSTRSIFTGLRSRTHFNRPDFCGIFKGYKKLNPNVQRFGVFSCGPMTMSRSVEEACKEMNNKIYKNDSTLTFVHHFENF